MPPTYRKCAPFCLPNSQSGLVGINKKSLCDGYFGCDEEIFETDEKALLSVGKDARRQHNSHLPWIKRKSPPVLSFFKRMASFRKNISKPQESTVKHYHTLPEPRTKSFYLGYKCLPLDSQITSLKRNYCCDGYFGCPTSVKS